MAIPSWVSSMVAEYCFNEASGTTLLDSSPGTPHNATMSGTGSRIAGRAGQGTALSSGGSYGATVDLSGVAASSSWTMTHWAYFSALPGNGGFVSLWNGSGGSPWVELTGTTTQARFDFLGANGINTITPAMISAGAWYFIAVTYSAANGLRLYVQPDGTTGAPAATVSATGTAEPAPWRRSIYLAGSTQQPGQVRLDDVRFINAELTAAQIAESRDIEGPAGVDPVVTVTVSRSTSWTTKKTIGDSAAASWATKSRVSDSAATSWATRSAVPAVSRSTSWDTLYIGTVSVSRSTSWVTKQAIVDSVATSWTTRIVVPPVTRATTWRALKAVPVTRPTLWRVLKVIPVFRPTEWNVERSGTATNTPGLRLKVYAPAGVGLGTLPAVQEAQAAYPLNDVGALTFGYNPGAPRAQLLGQPCEIAVEISPDRGVTWVEPRDSRFLYLADANDPTDPTKDLAVSTKSYVARLSKAIVYPPPVPRPDGKRAFLSSNGANPGLILKTLLIEGQARGSGALTGIGHSSFSTTLDSAGNAWAKTLTIYYTPGLDYLSVLQDLADQGFIDYHMRGRDLYVYNADTAMATDRTVTDPQVMLRSGRDLKDAPFRRTWEQMADTIFFLGKDGATYETTNAQADKPWGRQEVSRADARVSDQGTMAVISQQDLSMRDAPRTEYTRTLDFTKAAAIPFINYNVGEYVWSALKGQVAERLRVRQLTLTRDNDGSVSGNVVLNDRFLERDVRAARRIDGITNGMSGDAPIPGDIVPDDKVKPNPATGVVVSSDPYLGPGGFVQAAVTIGWAAPLLNEDGTLFQDLDHYEIYERAFGVNKARLAGTSTDEEWTNSPYVAGGNYYFSVVVVDRSGNRSAATTEVGHGMATDLTPPQAPSAPVVTANLGPLLQVKYNGLPSTGSWPGDLDYVEVHASTVNSFTPTSATLTGRLYGAGIANVPSAYGVVTYVRLVAVDKAGLKSPASAQGFAQTSRLVGTDLDPDAITYQQIGFKDPGNVYPDGSFESAAYRATLTGRSSAAWTFVTTDHYHGDWAGSINAASLPSTVRDLDLISVAESQQIKATEKLFTRMAYKITAGATGILTLVVEWILQDGSTSTSTLTGATKNGTWAQIAGQLVAPTNVERFRSYLRLDASGTSGTYLVDALEMRRTVNTSIIEDAAIKNAQISNLAVDNAKVAEMEVGKLSAGQLNADVLLAAGIYTAFVGQRVEMDGNGIRLFNSAGMATVEITPSKEYLRLNSTQDITLSSTSHPFQIGYDNGTNLGIDTNEIMARFNGAVTDLGLNLSGGDVHMSGMIRTRKITDNTVAFYSNQADLGLNFVGDPSGSVGSTLLSELQVTNGARSGRRPIGAAEFRVQSASAVKQDRADFDPFAIIRAAKAQRWKYKPGVADGEWHFGPMADDLPDVRTGSGETASLGIGSMVGVLWEAVRLVLQWLDNQKAK